MQDKFSQQKLFISLLGEFRIEQDGELISLPTRKAEALLAFLILNPEKHTREKLAAIFWGDSPDSSARGSLRKALTFLRKHIYPEIVITTKDTVQLNPDCPVDVDVRQFEDQAQWLLSAEAASPSQFSALVYTGNLLQDFDDDWVYPQRQYYRDQYIEALLRAIELARAQSEYQQAIDFAQNLLLVDPTIERAHQHIIFCYMTLGERTKALQQYGLCQIVLRDELGVDPTSETQSLYQWVRQTDTGALSLAAQITNLPIPISSFVGRSRELAAIKKLLGSSRLVTLVGTGGAGKTRLAIHAATDLIDSFKDGVWWVELAPVLDPNQVPHALAKALGLKPQSNKPVTEILSGYLQNKAALLVFDNCEHVIDSSAHLAESLLMSCAELKILATSREALALTGEHLWQIPPLSLPETSSITLRGLLMEYEGVRLFVERATALTSGFMPNDDEAVTITHICQRLDGIPLAIELAAACTRNLSLVQIKDGLDNRFRVINPDNRTSNLRHKTLRNALDWSYDLLSEQEKRLFCRLSIFAGGWTLDAAKEICTEQGIPAEDVQSLLIRLVEQSLIVFDAVGQRYSMLETMRQYGDEKIIEWGEEEALFQKYLTYYLKMAKIGDKKIRGPEQFSWLEWFNIERNNLKQAMDRPLHSTTWLVDGCELVSAICWYWGMVGDFAEAKPWIELAFSRSEDLGRTATRARALFSAGAYSNWGMNWLSKKESQAALEESLSIWQALAPNYHQEEAQTILTLGFVCRDAKLMQHSLDFFEETGNLWWQAWGLNLLFTGRILDDFYDLQKIQTTLKHEKELWAKTGDIFGYLTPVLDLGIHFLETRKVDDAKKHLLEGLDIAKKINAKGYLLQTLYPLGELERFQKNYHQASLYYQDCIHLVYPMMWESWLSKIYQGLGYCELAKEQIKESKAFFDQAMEMGRKFEMHHRELLSIAGFACIAAANNEPILAVQLFGAFFTLRSTLEKELGESILSWVNEQDLNIYLDFCKQDVGKNTYEQTFTEGSLLSFEEAKAKGQEISLG